MYLKKNVFAPGEKDVYTSGKSDIVFPVVALYFRSHNEGKEISSEIIATLAVDIEYSENHLRRCIDYAENTKTIIDCFIIYNYL